MYRQMEEVKSIRLEFEKLLDQLNGAIKRGALEIKDKRIRVVDWSRV